MANLVFPQSGFKPPSYNGFRPRHVDPRWRWFWDTVVFADPLWHGSNYGYDYAADFPATNIEVGHSNAIGPRGWRVRWDTTVSTARDWTYNHGAGASPNKRPQWLQFGNLAVFTVVELVAINAGDNIIVIEGGSGETAAENSLLYLSVESGGVLRYIHENGSGTNTTRDIAGFFTAGVRTSIGLIRDSASKTLKTYKNGVEVDSFNYTNDPDGATGANVSLGDRNDSDGGPELNGYIECAYVAKTPWSVACLLQLERDPWGPFRTAHRMGTASAPAGSTRRSFVAGMIG